MLREGLQRLDQAQTEARNLVSARQANLDIIGSDFPWPTYDRSGYALEVNPPNPRDVKLGLLIGRHIDSMNMLIVEPTGRIVTVPFFELEPTPAFQTERILEIDRKREVGINEYEKLRPRVAVAAEEWRKFYKNLPVSPRAVETNR